MVADRRIVFILSLILFFILYFIIKPYFFTAVKGEVKINNQEVSASDLVDLSEAANYPSPIIHLQYLVTAEEMKEQPKSGKKLEEKFKPLIKKELLIKKQKNEELQALSNEIEQLQYLLAK